jgi:hypothetical protein
MTFYQNANPLQEPFDMGIDENDRVRVTFNVLFTKRASGTLLRELVRVLVDAGVGVFGTTIFAGSNAQVPTEGPPMLQLRITGGPAPLRTQNQISPPAYPRPTVQFMTYADSYEAADALAQAAYAAVTGLRNVDITAF